MHPFNFLTKFSESGDGRWAGRWLEYTKAIDGKRRLYWSQGLKKRVALDELTDEEIAAKQEDRAYIAYQMTDPEWRKARHNIPAVLDGAEDSEDLKEIIENIEELDYYAVGSETKVATTLTFEEIDNVVVDFKKELEKKRFRS